MTPLFSDDAATVLDAAPDGVLVVDDSGTIRYVNTRLLEMFGYEAPTLLGRSVAVLVPDAARARHADHVAAYIGAPTTRPMGAQSAELSGRRRDGTHFPVEISLSPIITTAGPSVMAAVRDITVRVHLEADRRAVQKSLDQVSDAVLLFDAETLVVLHANRGAASQRGVTVEALLSGNTTPDELFPALAGAPLEEMLDELRCGRRAHIEVETVLRRADGTERHVELALQLPREAVLGGRACFLATAHDVTERRADREHLALLAEVRSRLLADEDTSELITFVADAACRLLGVARVTIWKADATGELEGNPPSRVQRVHRTGESAQRPGSPTEGSWMAEPLYTSDGRIAGVLEAEGAVGAPDPDPGQIGLLESLAVEVAVVIDLERVREDRRRLLVIEDRERIARDLHDVVIQRLFAAGMGLQSALHSSRLEERAEQTITALDDIIRSVRDTIFRLTSEAMGLADEVDTIVRRYRSPTVAVTVDVRGNLDAVPRARADHVGPVLNELLSNALRHGQATAILVELVVEPGRELTIRVTDDGRGLAEVVANGGFGLANLTERAYSLNGSFGLTPGNERGAVATWTVPLTLTS